MREEVGQIQELEHQIKVRYNCNILCIVYFEESHSMRCDPSSQELRVRLDKRDQHVKQKEESIRKRFEAWKQKEKENSQKTQALEVKIRLANCFFHLVRLRKRLFGTSRRAC